VIEFTGERVIPGQVDPDLWAEHVSRYAFAARFAPEALVLDVGCGAGYGTAELASRGRFAIGIDSAPEAIVHARSAYSTPNMAFIPASATALPFRDESFELVTAFEVIEHLTNWRDLLSEARRVLYPDGVFLVSTPNKEYYTDSRGASGPNPFHTHEFAFDEFHNALTEFFPYCTVLLQNHVEAFAFYQHSANSSVDGRMDGVRGTPQQAHFFLAVCALRKFPPSPGFLFVQQGSNVLREREKHIESLQQELTQAREQFAALHGAHDELTLHLEEQNRWALRTGEELETARRDLATLVEKLTAAETTVVERTLWAQGIEAERQQLATELENLRAQLAAQVEDMTARLNFWRSARWTKLGRKLNLGPDLDQSPGNRSQSKGDPNGGGS
jgi:ubiquinone/menaquinone biosynthesis C-methylase UbiE